MSLEQPVLKLQRPPEPLMDMTSGETIKVAYPWPAYRVRT